MSASFTKLRDGSWGLRIVANSIVPGTTVQVRKKSGQTDTKTIGRVVWSGNGVFLCTIQPDTHSSHRGTRGSIRGRRTGCACGSIEGEYHDWYCNSCRFEELDQ
jgi:hypothetical protein